MTREKIYRLLMVRYLELLNCKQSNMWELHNPRVIRMVHNIIKCVQEEKELDREVREYFINVVLSNLIMGNMILEKTYQTNTVLLFLKWCNGKGQDSTSN